MSKKHKRRPLAGRHLFTLGAVSLFGISGYELWIRMEDFIAAIQGVQYVSNANQTSFLHDLSVFFKAPKMQQMGFKMLFLCITILFGIACIIRRNRAKGAWILMVLDVAVGVAGWLLGVYGFHPSNWAQNLKIIPLLLIFAGAITNYVHRAQLKKRLKERHEHHHHHHHEETAEASQ